MLMIDDNDAQRALDWLCLRWCKTVNTNRASFRDDIVVLNSMPLLKSFFHRVFVDVRGILKVSFVWDVVVNSDGLNRVEVWNFDHDVWTKGDLAASKHVFKVFEKTSSTKKLLEVLFSRDEHVFAGYYPFVFKGESLEEILMKADLEDVKEMKDEE